MKALILNSLLFASVAQADIATDFKSLDDHRKGPFTVNYIQHTGGKSSLGSSATDGCVSFGGASGSALFQAASRNSIGQSLAAQDFYVANLFTTNYYELTGEYVYQDRCGSHRDDPAGLAAVAGLAMPKAASMVRHWVLEKHYIEHLAESALARGFRLRGISDTANESSYATLFFNFYLPNMTDDYQYLTAYLLAKESPIGTSSAIDRARTIIADSYDYFNASICGRGEGSSPCSDERVRRLYQLRNAVHNQLSQDVIGMIDAYLTDFPFYIRDGHTYLQKVREILVEYYSFAADKIAAQAEKVGLDDVANMANAIERDGSTEAGLLALSQLGADLRLNIASNPEKAVGKLVTIAMISQFVGKEISGFAEITSKDSILAILNTAYMEGFFIRDNYLYFVGEVNAAPDVVAAAGLIPDLLDIGQFTLSTAFEPALQQWLSVEPQMDFFVDNTIKSSALNVASLISEKIKR